MTDQHFELEDTVLKLSDYLKTIEMVVKETFAHNVWVKAEIRNLSSKGGHYYFELAEKDDDGKIVASCRGNLWRYQAERTLKKFAQHTGMQLTKDLTVMLKVTANMHPQYGLSLTIADIDPNYTIGDLARQYSAMLDRLVGEGLTQLNKSHQLALDLRHVIVIAPEKAAGLGDFRAEADHLERFGACNFYYHHATFQGNNAPKEIRHAIKNSVNTFSDKHGQLPDLMVIIRGGGAVGDLAFLNDYELSALVAEQPIPVWVGIGHERDKVILDEVAHTSFDTPSKVIQAIVHHLRVMAETTQKYMNTIKRISYQHIQLAEAHNQRIISQIQTKSSAYLINADKDSQYAMKEIYESSQRHLKQAEQQSTQYIESVKYKSQQSVKQINMSVNQNSRHVFQIAKNKIKQSQQQTMALYHQNKQISYQRLNQADTNSNHLREIILLQNPKRVLKQGYAIIRGESGKVITNIEGVHSASHTCSSVQIEMQDGEVTAVIQQ